MAVDQSFPRAEGNPPRFPARRDPADRWEADDDAADIRYSLTALGEALVSEARGRRFGGFGPCAPQRREEADRGRSRLTRRAGT